jgi:hypothetical protein
MEPEGSLPYSQEPSAGPDPEPGQSSSYHPILSKIHFNIIQQTITRRSNCSIDFKIVQINKMEWLITSHKSFIIDTWGTPDCTTNGVENISDKEHEIACLLNNWETSSNNLKIIHNYWVCDEAVHAE